MVYRHALRNAFIPILTVSGMQFGYLLGGSVIIETIFSWPGIGRLAVNSIMNRDLAVVQGTVLVFTLIFILINLLVDILYAAIDPGYSTISGGGANGQARVPPRVPASITDGSGPAGPGGQFRRNRLALIGLGIITVLWGVALLADYIAP